jgi:hypothetical protein
MALHLRTAETHRRNLDRSCYQSVRRHDSTLDSDDILADPDSKMTAQ